MNDQISLYKALSVGRPWVLGIQNQVVSYCGAGVCDPLLQNSVSALEPFRYDTGLFQWSLVATNLPGGGSTLANSDGSDLALPTQTEVDLFTAGVGQPITGGWWNKTISDTDLFKAGAPVDRGFMFLVTGLAMSAMDPFQRGGTGAAIDDPKLYSNWLQESHNGPGYSFLIQKFHLNYTAISIAFGDQGTQFRLGVMGFYPEWGGPTGAQTLRNGQTATPGMYMPLTTALCVASRDDVKQMTLALTSGQQGRVQNNPAQPTIAGSQVGVTTGLINTLNSGTVYAPVRAMLAGYIVCVPFENYCGIPALTPDEINLLRQRIGLQPTPGAPLSPPVGAIAYQAGQ